MGAVGIAQVRNVCLVCAMGPLLIERGGEEKRRKKREGGRERGKKGRREGLRKEAAQSFLGD